MPHTKFTLDNVRAMLAEPTQEMLDATLVDVHEPDPEYRAMLAGEVAEHYRAMVARMPDALLASVLERACAAQADERDAEIKRLRSLLADAREYVSDHAADERALYAKYPSRARRYEVPARLVVEIDAALTGAQATPAVDVARIVVELQRTALGEAFYGDHVALQALANRLAGSVA